MFLRFFGLGILAFEVSESHIERLVPEPDTDCVYRHAFLMQRVGVSLAEAVKLCTFDASILCNRFEFRAGNDLQVCLRCSETLGQWALFSRCGSS